MKKVCNKCKVEKELTDFHKCNSRIDGNNIKINTYHNFVFIFRTEGGVGNNIKINTYHNRPRSYNTNFKVGNNIKINTYHNQPPYN